MLVENVGMWRKVMVAGPGFSSLYDFEPGTSGSPPDIEML